MDFEKVLSLRQAVRAYTDEPVSEEQLKAILNAAYRAPVGMHNFAGYHLTVITRPELLALMVDTARKVTGKDNNPLYGAPAFILVSATKDAIQKIVGQDAGCIMENMHLKAADLHLGAVYIFGMVNAIKGGKGMAEDGGITGRGCANLRTGCWSCGRTSGRTSDSAGVCD